MGARGETVINYKGRDVPLLFTNRALASAEKQTGKGIIGMMEGFLNGSSGYGELVALMRSGMEAARQEVKASGKPISNSDVFEILDEVGFTYALNPVMEAVAEVISYSPDEEKEITEDDDNPN